MQSSGATQMRFWGKIQGITKDYYIAEGTLELKEEEVSEVQDEPVEVRGQGTNKYVYWACNSPLSQWTKLPDLKPSQIKNARNIKVLFTGNL